MLNAGEAEGTGPRNLRRPCCKAGNLHETERLRALERVDRDLAIAAMDPGPSSARDQPALRPATQDLRAGLLLLRLQIELPTEARKGTATLLSSRLPGVDATKRRPGPRNRPLRGKKRGKRSKLPGDPEQVQHREEQPREEAVSLFTAY